MASRLEREWNALDPTSAPRIVWLRPPSGSRVATLLGAFDPPTLAHVALVEAAARLDGAHGAFCLTKTLLARPTDVLLPPLDRVRLLEEIASEQGFALALTNRGTYLEVGRAMAHERLDPSFVLGSDKLPKLEDPSFYADGRAGVEATFRELRLRVVPRGSPVRRDDVTVLDPAAVFPRGELGNVSATEVRRRVASGREIDHLVPPLVARALEGYTGASERE